MNSEDIKWLASNVSTVLVLMYILQKLWARYILLADTVIKIAADAVQADRLQAHPKTAEIIPPNAPP